MNSDSNWKRYRPSIFVESKSFVLHEECAIKMIAIKELIEKFNNANTRKRDKQKIKNELVRRGGVVFQEIR